MKYFMGPDQKRSFYNWLNERARSIEDISSPTLMSFLERHAYESAYTYATVAYTAELLRRNYIEEKQNVQR